MAFKFPTNDTAFAVGRQKRPRVESGSHLAFLRTLPCIACGTRSGIQAAHIRYRDDIYGKRETGMGIKPDDAFALPLCSTDHGRQHAGSERQFWNRLGIDACMLALILHHYTGDADLAETIIRLHQGREA